MRCVLYVQHFTKTMYSTEIKFMIECKDTVAAPNHLMKISDLASWLRQNGLNPVETLGQGTAGVAILLSTGEVIKITKSPREFGCVDYIVNHHLESEHLPEIFDYGTTPWGDYFILREHLYELSRNLRNSLPPSPSFLLDKAYLRQETPEVMDFYAQVKKATQEFKSLGLDFLDIDWIHNWGKRDNGTVVFYDLSCVPE